MGEIQRSKKKVQLWKKALVHFSLCFVMGFFTGFAPTSTTQTTQIYNPIIVKPNLIEAIEKSPTHNRTGYTAVKPKPEFEPDDDASGLNPPGLLIIVTTTRPKDPLKRASLTRLAHTLRLVRSPLVWVVVEAHKEVGSTAEMLRRTGIMYRHLTFKENFTDPGDERHHQRNVALSHVERHRLTGILHFADLDSVYDLQFFEELRQIKAFGTWPVAKLSVPKNKITIEGPLCRDRKVVGWFTKDAKTGSTQTVHYSPKTASTVTAQNKRHEINASGFAFNSSILWDPERWGRPTSLPDTSQDSVRFVEEVVQEDESKLKGIPADCSTIMLWRLHTPKAIQISSTEDLRTR
ncbi:hypothetical protein LUZ60_003789 [Juncus effusus]|nr:hypothetical protein LUZ60_003789 [Juncus effusus]